MDNRTTEHVVVIVGDNDGNSIALPVLKAEPSLVRRAVWPNLFILTLS